MLNVVNAQKLHKKSPGFSTRLPLLYVEIELFTIMRQYLHISHFVR